jgi:C1A family cysteine protease
VDLRAGCSPVESQGELGSCTANALVGNLEFLQLKSGGTFVDRSRLFVYYNERAIEGTISSDSGAFLRDGIKSLAKQGVCDEAAWPYKINKFASKPPLSCYTQAKKNLVASYHRLNTVDEMRSCLAEGFPFVFGFTVYDSFDSDAVANTGVVNLPKPSEGVRGGHAVMAVGYDHAKRRFLIRNSWDTDWGMKGYFTMPYDYLADRELSDDFWTIRK